MYKLNLIRQGFSREQTNYTHTKTIMIEKSSSSGYEIDNKHKLDDY